MSGLVERAERYRPLVQQEMRDIVGERPEPLYAWMRYHLGWEDQQGAPVTASPGKLMRPVAVLLAAEIAGGRAEQAVAAAAAVELVHNFSLLHDDIEDASEFRRGRPNLWTFAGAAQAINTGDGMFVVARLAQYRLLEVGVPAERVLLAMRELDEACLRLVHGQYLDMSFETRRDVTLDEYLEMAGGKTAAMFASPFAIGATLGGASPALVDAFREFGRRVGLAFQAVDDVLGIWGDPAVTGKPVGDDLLARKMTYPVIVALNAGGEESEALRHAYARPAEGNDDIPAMARWIEATGAREATEAKAREETSAALDGLRAAGVPPETLAVLLEYAEAAVGRVT
ncbi:MAG: polyprenyl synthetase family protein [Chloroflexi bacterium]|nr:polyprenyl synthetase family protein [Chloroflexota bacterium]MDA1240387.1 polyprenyl synthetase family protein [Chloroflexota bacterium]MQC47763.1 polyprenyl synthetase family protein [Chloroflexota bacterium]